MGVDEASLSSRTQDFTGDAQERLGTVEELVSRLRDLNTEAPNMALAIFYPGLRLESRSLEDACVELRSRVLSTTADQKLQWVVEVDPRPDNRFMGYASPYIRGANPEIDTGILFTFSALLTGLNVFRLTALWRAHEFAEAFCDAFSKRRMLTAAACARSLLEGVATFAGTTQKALTSWDNLKASGRPSSLKQVGEFYDEFRGYLHVAQHASRIDGLEKHAPRATNVMTHVEKVAKVGGDKIKASYHWLSDAVHGSFGSNIVYHVSLQKRGGGSVVTEDYARDPEHLVDADASSLSNIIPEQALDATIFSAQLVISELELVRWLIHDIGLTTGLAFRSTPNYPCHTPLPERNASCPCGSGRKFKKCVHTWGESGRPPHLM
jgi:hypothetical protein